MLMKVLEGHGDAIVKQCLVLGACPSKASRRGWNSRA